MRGKLVLIVLVLLTLAYSASSATEHLYAASQSCTPGTDCTLNNGNNVLGEEDSLRGSAEGNWGQREIIWNFTMDDSPALGAFINATVTVYNFNLSWILNGQSDTIMLEYCLSGSCNVVENFTSEDQSPSFNRTYNAPSIASFQDANSAYLRFHGDPQFQSPDSMTVFLDAASIDINYQPPALNASSTLSNETVFALESTELAGSCSCTGIGNCTDTAMTLQDNNTGTFSETSTSEAADIYSNASSYFLGTLQANTTVNRTFNITANTAGSYQLRLMCTSANALGSPSYSSSNLTVNPNIYEANILSPNSTSPIGINAGENLTIRFNFTKNGNEITSNIEIVNITVGGLTCTEIPGLSYSSKWEVNCTTDEALSGGLKDLVIFANYTNDPGIANATSFQSVNATSLTSPNVTSVSMENQVDLVAGGSTGIACNASVIDVNGDISGATATFFFSSNESDDPDDNNFHYSTTCLETGSAGDLKNYTCSFDVVYYAVNGTWTCNVTATDSKGASGSSQRNTTINPLFALNISTSMISYSDMKINQTSNENIVNITNLGNRPINVSVWGFGQELSDNLSMVCQNNNISIEYERFSDDSISFSQKIPLSSDPQSLSFTIPKQTTSETIPKETYWQMHIPVLDDPVSGQCTGNVIFEAGPA